MASKHVPAHSAIVYVPMTVISLLLVLIVLFLALWTRRPTDSGNEKITQRLLLALITLHVFCKSGAFVRYAFCIDCSVQIAVNMVFMLIAKGVNYAFFIHRAKLAQGMSPIFAKKWFEKIFPVNVIIFHNCKCIECVRSIIQSSPNILYAF